MKFSIISDAFQQMEATSKRLELTDILVKLIQEIPEDVIAKAIYLIQGKLRPNFEGVELGIAEKLVMRAMSKSSGIPLKKIEDDYNKGGDLGQTAENILEQKIQTTFASEVITLEKVYDTLFKISKLEGKGSQEMKMKYVSSMLNDATPQESKFILKILLGTLRLGIAENTVMDALAIAFTGKKENREIIENAYNVSSDLGKVAEVISTRGVEEIEKFQIKLFYSTEACSLQYAAICACVPNHTSLNDLIYSINSSNIVILDRCPEICGCRVSKKRPRSLYAPSNSALKISSTDDGGVYGRTDVNLSILK